MTQDRLTNQPAYQKRTDIRDLSEVSLPKILKLILFISFIMSFIIFKILSRKIAQKKLQCNDKQKHVISENTFNNHFKIQIEYGLLLVSELQPSW